MPEESREQRFGPTSGVLTGWAGVVLSVVVAVALVVEDPSVTAFGIAALLLAVGVLAWCYLLRPRVLLTARSVVLRNAFTDWVVPLAAVEDVVVRQTTVVATDDRIYRGIGVGRPLRKIVKQRAGERPAEVGAKRLPSSLTTAQVPDFMIQQVLERSAHAGGSAPEPARREYAVPELVLVGVFLLLFVVLALL